MVISLRRKLLGKLLKPIILLKDWLEKHFERFVKLYPGGTGPF